MFCQKCGQEISEHAVMCPKCEAPTKVAVNPPKNYLAQSIIVTVLCCWPLGIPAIVFAAQVNSKFAAGDIEGAIASSKKANMWCWIAFGVGLASILAYLGLVGLGLITSGAR